VQAVGIGAWFTYVDTSGIEVNVQY